jgi:hypothetical protein
MSTQITTAFVQQYKANLQHLVQQKGSRLRGAVRIEMVNGEFGYFDQIGASVSVKRASRHADTPLNDTPHARRQVGLEDYEAADLIDNQDKIRLLISPESDYAKSQAMAHGRSMDDAIILAATAAAKTGKTGTTSVALPSGQKIATAASGLTLAKLLSAKEILDAAENDPDEERYIALRAKDVTTLLNTTEVKSSDFNTVKALAEGKIDTYLGFKFIRTQRLITLVGGGSDVACLGWCKSGILLALGEDIRTRMSERADKSYSLQVYSNMSIGATRMQEESVVEIAVQA